MEASRAHLVSGARPSPKGRVLAAIAMLVGVLVAVVTLLWLGTASAGAVASEGVQTSATSRSKIAFTEFRYDTLSYEIYKVNPDGSNVQRLTRSRSRYSDNLGPAWSPNGRKIVFVRERYDPNDESYHSSIYKMNADGTKVERLTSGYDAFDPAWSPDGTKIAFASNRDGNVEIYVMNTKGNNVTKIGPKGYYAYSPAWSPNGEQIAFSGYEEGNWQNKLYVMNPDGTDVSQVPSSYEEEAFAPDWSPDGSKIAYTDGSSIRLMNADGSDDHYLEGTGSEWTDEPSWSPDGKTIAYTRYWDYDIDDVSYMAKVKADGSTFGDGSQYRVLRSVHMGHATVEAADWSPRIRR